MKKISIKQRDEILYKAKKYGMPTGGNYPTGYCRCPLHRFGDWLNENTEEKYQSDRPYQEVYSRPEPKTKPPTNRPQHPCPECGEEMVLYMYTRPFSPPGNAFICQNINCGRFK